MFIAALFTIAKKWDKQKCIFIWEILFDNKNEVVLHSKIWINHRNNMLNERNQSQRPHDIYDSISMKYPK